MAERQHTRARWLARHAIALLSVGILVAFTLFAFQSHGPQPSLARRASTALKKRAFFNPNIFDFGPRPGGGAVAGPATPQSVSQIGQAMANDFMNQFSGMMQSASQNQRGLSGLVGALGAGVGSGAAEGLGNGADAIARILKNPAPTPPQAEGGGLKGIAFALGNGVAGGLTSAINVSALGGLVSPQLLADAAGGLGTGLGSGATTGLNINRATQTTTQNANGLLGPIALALGSGLSSSFLGTVDTAKLTSAVDVDSLMQQAGAIAGSVGQGLGQGAAQGITRATSDPEQAANEPGTTVAGQATGNLTARDVVLKKRQMLAGTAQMGATPSVSDIALNFSQSLAFNFLGNTNLSKVTGMLGGQDMLETIAQAAPAVGSGLGSGAADGLKKMMGMTSGADSQTSLTLARRQEAAVAPGATNTSVASIANSFSFSLASNFLGETNLSALAPTTGMAQISQTLVDAAPGLGRGLGGGAAQGLGLIKEAVPVDASKGNTSASVIAESFSGPLAFNFLNGANFSALASRFTASTGMTMDGMMDVLGGINFTRAASSLAGGLVVGAGQSLFPNSTPPTADPEIQNDTVSSVARGFGTGLGGEGVKVVLSVLGNKNMMEPAAATIEPAAEAPTADSNNTLQLTTRRRSLPGYGMIRRSKAIAIAKRQEASPENPMSASGITNTLLNNVNFTEVNNIAQKGATALQCEGVGSFFQLQDALKRSGTLDISNLTSAPGMGTNFMLPDVTINITSDGNLFQLNPAQGSLLINGLTQPRLTVLLVVHIAAIIIAIYTLLPNIVILGLLPRLFSILGIPQSVLLTQPTRFLVSAKMQHILHAIVFSLSMISLIFGVLANGNASHFHTPHQIIGFVMMTMIFAHTFFHVYRTVTSNPETANRPMTEKAVSQVASPNKQNNFITNIHFVLSNVLLGLSQLQLALGFTDLNAITFCLTSIISLPQAVTIGAGLATSVSIAFGAITIQFLVNYWEKKRDKARGVSQDVDILVDVIRSDSQLSKSSENPARKNPPSRPKRSFEVRSGWYQG